MNNQISEVIKKVIHIPRDLHTRKDVSELNLLLESGYIELCDQIQEDEITEVLKMHPHMINDWLQYSEDKRSSPTWHFFKGESGKYYVEYSAEGKETEEIVTTDQFKACATFIKREIEIDKALIKGK